MKRNILKVLLFSPFMVLAGFYLVDTLRQDQCLDSGHRWNQDLSVCETADMGKVDLVKVDKSEGKMLLLSEGIVVKEYSVVFGANPEGHKQREGDEKTPEGLYTLDYKKEDSSFYRAMHIDYPNEQDKQVAAELGVSPGGFIMVHGQRNYMGWLAPVMQYFNWTDGCIALTNNEMDDFMSLVAVGTPIEIQW